MSGRHPVPSNLGGIIIIPLPWTLLEEEEDNKDPVPNSVVVFLVPERSSSRVSRSIAPTPGDNEIRVAINRKDILWYFIVIAPEEGSR